VKKSEIERIGLAALTPGPSPRWGEGKVNIKFNSLAPLGERVAERRVRG